MKIKINTANNPVKSYGERIQCQAQKEVEVIINAKDIDYARVIIKKHFSKQVGIELDRQLEFAQKGAKDYFKKLFVKVDKPIQMESWVYGCFSILGGGLICGDYNWQTGEFVWDRTLVV